MLNTEPSPPPPPPLPSPPPAQTPAPASPVAPPSPAWVGFLNDNAALTVIWGLWSVTTVVICVRTVIKYVHKPEVTAFRQSALSWWSGQDIYEPGTNGFLYFPQSALAFTALQWNPIWASELLWRWAAVAIFLSGLWRASAALGGRWRNAFFAVASLLSLPWAAGSLVSGQVNGPLIGLLLHAGVELAGRRWWHVVLYLILALTLKPQAIVMCLLAAALVAAVRWRMALGLLAFLAAPFLTRPPAYVIRQYHLCGLKLIDAGTPSFSAFEASDFSGLLHRLGLDLTQNVQWGVRTVAALATLVLSWLAYRRMSEPWRSLYVVFLSVSYILLFNPRAQADTYIMLGPVVGFAVAYILVVKRRRAAAAALAVVSLLSSLSNNLFFGRIANPGELFKPAAGLIVLIWLVVVGIAPGRHPAAPES